MVSPWFNEMVFPWDTGLPLTDSSVPSLVERLAQMGRVNSDLGLFAHVYIDTVWQKSAGALGKNEVERKKQSAQDIAYGGEKLVFQIPWPPFFYHGVGCPIPREIKLETPEKKKSKKPSHGMAFF